MRPFTKIKWNKNNFLTNDFPKILICINLRWNTDNAYFTLHTIYYIIYSIYYIIYSIILFSKWCINDTSQKVLDGFIEIALDAFLQSRNQSIWSSIKGEKIKAINPSWSCEVHWTPKKSLRLCIFKFSFQNGIRFVIYLKVQGILFAPRRSIAPSVSVWV